MKTEELITSNMDSPLLVLKTVSDKKPITKTLDFNTHEKISDFDGMWYYYEVWQGDFHANILELLTDSERAIVLGAPVPGLDDEKKYRKTKSTQPDGYPATILDRKGREIVLDLDDIEIPDYDPLNPTSGIKWLLSELGLSGIKCTWQITSSQQIDSNIARLRLYLLCSKELSLNERKIWIKHLPIRVDLAPFTCNQIIYTAPPVFWDEGEDGDDGKLVDYDFIETRCGVIDGAETFELVMPKSVINEGGEVYDDSSSADGNTSEWMNEVLEAKDFHTTMNRRAMALMRMGLSNDETEILMEGVMNKCPEKDTRWQARFDDINRAVTSGRDRLRKPRPLPIFDYQYSDLPSDLLPTVMTTAAMEIARVSFAPFGYAANGMFPVIGTSIGGRVFVEERSGILNSPANANEIFTDETGGYKSTFFNLLFAPITKYENNLIGDWKNDVINIKASNDYWKKIVDKIKRDVGGKDDTGSEQMIMRMAMAEANIKPVPHRPVLYAQDATDEGLSLECYQQGGCISMASPEGGEFIDILLGKYKDDNTKGNVFFLKAVTGERVQKTRAGAANYTIPRAVLNSLMFIQYFKLAPLLNDEGSRKQGVLARFGVNSAPSRVGQRIIENISDIHLESRLVQPFYDSITENLDQRFAQNENHIVPMDKDTELLWKDIYNRNEKRLGSDLKDYKEEVNKVTTKTVKKAYMLQRMDGRTGSLKSEYLEAADLIEQHNIRELVKMRQAAERGDEVNYARGLLGWMVKAESRFKVYQHDGFTKSGLEKALKGTTLARGLESALAALSLYGWLTPDSNRRYRVNFNAEEALDEFKRLPEDWG